MPDNKGKALLTDIGTEELAHVEMISAMIYQLLNGATLKELKEAGLASQIYQKIWQQNKKPEPLMKI